jgi:hypothetical protein
MKGDAGQGGATAAQAAVVDVSIPRVDVKEDRAVKKMDRAKRKGRPGELIVLTLSLHAVCGSLNHGVPRMAMAWWVGIQGGGGGVPSPARG